MGGVPGSLSHETPPDVLWMVRGTSTTVSGLGAFVVATSDERYRRSRVVTSPSVAPTAP